MPDTFTPTDRVRLTALDLLESARRVALLGNDDRLAAELAEKAAAVLRGEVAS